MSDIPGKIKDPLQKAWTPDKPWRPETVKLVVAPKPAQPVKQPVKPGSK